MICLIFLYLYFSLEFFFYYFELRDRVGIIIFVDFWVSKNFNSVLSKNKNIVLNMWFVSFSFFVGYWD